MTSQPAILRNTSRVSTEWMMLIASKRDATIAPPSSSRNILAKRVVVEIKLQDIKNSSNSGEETDKEYTS